MDAVGLGVESAMDGQVEASHSMRVHQGRR